MTVVADAAPLIFLANRIDIALYDHVMKVANEI